MASEQQQSDLAYFSLEELLVEISKRTDSMVFAAEIALEKNVSAPKMSIMYKVHPLPIVKTSEEFKIDRPILARISLMIDELKMFLYTMVPPQFTRKKGTSE